MKHLMLIAAACAASPLWAAEWAVRPGDIPLSPAELNALAGRTLTFYDDGQSKYSAGGAYSYTYSAVNGGGTAFGTYRIAADGSICVQYRNGFDRCDLYVRNNGRLILITEKGERYPVRPE
ncbi:MULTISPECIES: hypothetical protein [Ruegeria]|uniref:hypothetical protein n=1 Tax=Ruegeria TaxID=97050 RepID=UPI00147B0022|nr:MULTISPECIES: hypothetical protein [Ruegeria]UWR07738.1 hypothetical protein K3752_01885 [Ruegeria sp. B32]